MMDLWTKGYKTRLCKTRATAFFHDDSWGLLSAAALTLNTVHRGSFRQCVPCHPQVPMCAQWDDICVGMKVEVLNTNAVLPSKVYWIATVIQVAGADFCFSYEKIVSGY